MSESRMFYVLDERVTEKIEHEEEIPFNEVIEYAALAIIEMKRHSSEDTADKVEK